MKNNQSKESSLNDKQLEILMSNYNNLHQSFWDAHKVALQVTQIFMTVISAGIVILLDTKKGEDKFTLLIVTISMELIVIVWWLFMRMLKGYNDSRRIRLKDIEQDINDSIKKETGSSSKKKWLIQYSSKEQGGLEYKKPWYNLQFSSTIIYHFIFAAYNSILLTILLNKLQKDIQNDLLFVFVPFTVSLIIMFIVLLLYEHCLEQCNKNRNTGDNYYKERNL